jgi:uncharacterized protein HemX
MSTEILPPAQSRPHDALSFGQNGSQRSSAGSRNLIIGLVVALVLVAGAGFLAMSSNQGKSAAEAARDQAIAERDSARASLVDAQASLDDAQSDMSTLQSQYESAQSEVDSLQNKVAASAWKVRAYNTQNACIDSIIAAYNSVTYQVQLGPALDNTFRNGPCEKVFSFTRKNT